MALFKGDILIAGTNPSGGGAGGGHVIQDSSGVEFEQRPALQFIGADIVDDDINEATQVITPSFREIQGDIPDTNLVCLDGIPIGGIIPYGAPINTLSQDWLPCLGQAVSRTFYHELFEKYGTIYGDGDGSTTFNLPNYGGRVPVGLDENDTDFDTLGATLGEKKHTLTVSEIPSHYHNLSVHSGGNTAAPIAGVANTSNASGSGLLTNSNFRIQNTGGGQSHNNIQPSIVANYIVKAKTSSHTITTSNVMTIHNESDENTYSTNYINDNLINTYNLVTNGDEVKTGFKIDGKDVYAKRYSLPSLSNATKIAHGITNFELIDWNIMTLAGGVYRKLNYTTTVYYIVDVDETNISLYCNGSLSGTGKITLYYTYN